MRAAHSCKKWMKRHARGQTRRLRLAVSLAFVKLVNDMDFMCARFNARDRRDKQRDEKEYLMNGDSQHKSNGY